MSGKDLDVRPARDLERPYGPSALLAPDNSGTVIMEDCRILFRNFSGKPSQFNKEGDRNFCVILHPEIAPDMEADGWNVKQLKPAPDGTPGDFYLQVSIGYKVRPPRIVVLTPQNDGSMDRMDLGQHECEMLDWVDIARTDLIVRPYNYDVNGAKGIKAYCKTLFVTISLDYFEQKYLDVPQREGGIETLEIEQYDGDVVPGEVLSSSDEAS